MWMFLQHNYNHVFCVALSDGGEKVLIISWNFKYLLAWKNKNGVLEFIFLFFPRYPITKGAVYSGYRRWWWGAHSSWSFYWTWWNLLARRRGCGVEGDSKVSVFVSFLKLSVSIGCWCFEEWFQSCGELRNRFWI